MMAAMHRSIAALVLALSACSAPTQSAPPPPTPEPTLGSDDASVDPPIDAHCTDPRPTAAHECVRDCGPPVVRPEDPEPAWRWLSVDEAAQRQQHGCPRCLPEATQIATPVGDRAVAALAVGDPIWTLDRAGRRIAARVVHVGWSPVTGGQMLIRVTLADGRVVAASAGHPDAAGRTLAELAPGAGLSGSTVVAVEHVRHLGTRTYDVLPSGETGTYWADGVVLSSTFATPGGTGM